MDADRWAKIKPVFNAALAQPDEARAAFVRSQCAGDEALALEIQSLLAAHDRAHSFIESPALKSAGPASAPDSAEAVGQLIGPYRMIRKLGAGGMGAVYLAARADESFDKQVAIKLIRPGLDTDLIIRRFVSERQILARLEHPNIARLLDGGTAESGVPYLVMEYVEGQSLIDYCGRRALQVAERLKLFRKICAAVHYAHQNLIVHRDIKPGNVLVNDAGEPKLLDFGIAKLLSPEVESARTATQFGPVMTPDYASPEQARGEPVTTASDVYSLGVLLYELLTGSRPYRITSASPIEMARVICEIEPARPSTAVDRRQATSGAAPATDSAPAAGQAQPGGPSADKLRRQLEGDLDNIILKALRKAPRERYASVQELSEDLGRHLDGLPVIARPATLGYRVNKFIGRHRAGVASTVIILLLLVAAIIGITRQTIIASKQRARAEKRFNEVRKLANSFMFRFHDAIAQLPGATEARQLVVSESLQYLNSLADEAGDDPSLQRELATAYFRLGDIQALSTSGNLGDTRGALDSHRQALALRQSLAAASPHDPDLQRDLAASYLKMGELLPKAGDPEGAFAHCRQAAEISEALLAANPKDRATRRGLAFIYHGTANLLARKDPAAALDHYNQAIVQYDACLAADPDDPPLRRNLSLLYKNAGALIHQRGDKDSALIMYRKALAIDEAELAATPNAPDLRLALSFSYGSIGSALESKGDLSSALDNYRRALDLRLAVASADAKNAFARDAVIRAYERIGGIMQQMKDDPGAIACYRQLLAFHEAVNALPQQAATCAKIAGLYSQLAEAAARPARLIDLRNAIEWDQKSLALRQQTDGEPNEAEAKERARIADEISRCRAALERSTASR